ncbi:superoxide dismutase [Candidatus Pacearchaeota archaeon]|nr:superoxide dismutase [Candidatus Pacearchaeota archaeon]
MTKWLSKMITLPKLPYAYSALASFVGTQTMEIHHTKHHQTYVDKLNEALSKYPSLGKQPVEELLSDLDTVPADIRMAVRNHGGGHVNHSLFWEILSPHEQKIPKSFEKVLVQAFGSVDAFKEQFSAAALSRFGSGWAWLVVDGDSVEIYSTPNQDSPLMEGKIPLLGLDVWEHAYYLHYQNKRADYVKAFWKHVNWDKVVSLYDTTQ